MLSQSPRDGQQTIRKLAAEIDAWRRARRTARHHFSNWAPVKRAESVKLASAKNHLFEMIITAGYIQPQMVDAHA